MLTCYKFHLLCLTNTFRCKTKPKQKRNCSCNFIESSTTRKWKKKQLFCIFPKWTACNVQVVVAGTSSYVTLITALIPAEHKVPYVEEERSNVDCIPMCSELRHCEHIITIYVHTHIYIYIYIYIYMNIWVRFSGRCSCI